MCTKVNILSGGVLRFERVIPMIAENNSIKVLADGNLEVNGVASTKLTVGLRRLAAVWMWF